MESPLHDQADLFRQLGLPDEPAAIGQFIASHRPIPPDVALADAPCWTPSQARFLREEITKDADWAVVIDALNLALRDKAS